VRHLREFRVQLGLVAALALSVRVWWVLAYTRNLAVEGDQLYYHVQADALAHGAGFVNPFAWNDAVTRVEIPSALHPPLYSLYLGAGSVRGGPSPLAHRLASCLLGAATVVVIGLVARRLGGDRVGVLAALLAALYPNLWINDGVIAAESLYALTIAFVLLTSYRFWQSPTNVEAAWVGAAIALAALTRAEAAILFAFLALPLVLWKVDAAWRDRFRLLVVVGATGALVLAPWFFYNLARFDEPVPLSNGSGYVLEIANCDETFSGPHLGYWDLACDRDETWIVRPPLDHRMTAEQQRQASFDAGIENARLEIANERSKREAGLTYVNDNLDRFPVVVLARIGRMWEVYQPGQNVDLNVFFERRGRASSEAALASYYLLAALSAVGLVALYRRRVTIVPFLSLGAMVTITAAMSFGITRYRIGADVALTVLAALGVQAVFRWWRGKRWRGRGVTPVVEPVTQPGSEPERNRVGEPA
jgi:4-amino-4-deoxy-L-arabinose transferase-like glycosyltransferase